MKCGPRYHLTEMQRLRNKGDKATFVFLIHAFPIYLISPWKLDCVGGKVFRGPSWSRSTESLVLVGWPWLGLPFKLYNLSSNAISDRSIGSLSKCFQMFLYLCDKTLRAVLCSRYKCHFMQCLCESSAAASSGQRSVSNQLP